MPWSLGDPNDTRSITSMSPATATAPGMASGSFTLTFVVEGFSGDGAIVWLVQDNQPVLKGSNVQIAQAGSALKVTADFDSTGWSAAAGGLTFDAFVGEVDLSNGAWSDAQFELTESTSR